MVQLNPRRGPALVAFLLAVALLGGAVWTYGYRQALEQVAARGETDLALASDQLVAELKRYRMTAVLLADHPTLTALPAPDGRAAAEALLLASVDRTGAMAAYFADPEGRILAASHPVTPDALARTGYFRRALDGAMGAEHGSSLGFRRRAYSFAAPSFGPDGRVQAVLVLVVDIDNLEQDWRGARPAVWFTVAGGQVFVTSRSELLFWQRDADGFLRADGTRADIVLRQVGGFRLWRQDLSAYVPGQALHLSRALPVIGMTAEALIDVAPAQRLAALQAAAVVMLSLVFGLALFVATERRRALAAANAVLESRVKARTEELETTNAALRREVAEREEAEAALRRAQADLVQAGKLSALGQMSAGISHELNQPLMAIRQFAENGTAYLARGAPGKAGENLGRISEMAARAARIIKNLRAFARNESEPVGRVDLARVLESAVELTEARLRADGVVLHWQRPDAPVWALGGEVRLAQVFVNLINNAADAMQGQAAKEIALAIGAGPIVTVRDTGPGIADPERVFEPFYSTKEVEGMGLGLSISYGLVQSFGGRIRGANLPEGGAVFTVALEPFEEEQAA